MCIKQKTQNRLNILLDDDFLDLFYINFIFNFVLEILGNDYNMGLLSKNNIQH